LPNPDHNLLIRYLLGDLTAPEREQVEEAYFRNGDIWQALREVETGLIDSYVTGELTERQRTQFEGFFLTSGERRDRVSVAQALRDPAIRDELMASIPPPLPPNIRDRATQREFKGRWRWHVLATAAAMVLLITAVSLLWIQNKRLRSAMDSLQAEMLHSYQSVRSGDQNVSEGEWKPSLLVLEPGLVRSTGGRSVTFSASGHSAVVLMLDLRQDNHSTYDVVVQKVEGQIVQRIAGLRSHPIPHGKVVAVELPSQLLEDGEYVVNLFGDKESGPMESYLFLVRR
jgi:hypothetical protein